MKIIRILLLILSSLMGTSAFGAPIPPIGPLDISGVIEEVEWFPERPVKGIPRMSGSSGKDRVVSPHFLIRLKDFEGVEPEVALRMTRYLDCQAINDKDLKGFPPLISIKVDWSDRNYLKKRMRIRVRGYKIGGDEGGTWTTFSGIEIIK
jgi:hypothetical protein